MRTRYDAEIALAFKDTYCLLNQRIGIFTALPLRSLNQLSLQNKLREIGRMSGAAPFSAMPHAKATGGLLILGTVQRSDLASCWDLSCSLEPTLSQRLPPDDSTERGEIVARAGELCPAH
jgi:hypothetical protein